MVLVEAVEVGDLLPDRRAGLHVLIGRIGTVESALVVLRKSRWGGEKQAAGKKPGGWTMGYRRHGISPLFNGQSERLQSFGPSCVALEASRRRSEHGLSAPKEYLPASRDEDDQAHIIASILGMAI